MPPTLVRRIYEGHVRFADMLARDPPPILAFFGGHGVHFYYYFALLLSLLLPKGARLLGLAQAGLG